MIRTRDFILYLLCLFFVVLAAVYTGVSDLKVSQFGLGFIFSDSSMDTPPVKAQKPDDVFNRESRIAQLREKISNGDGDREDLSPSVPTPVTDQVPPEEETENVSDRTAQYCNTAANSALVAVWPSNVVLQEVEGVRMGYVTEVEEVVVGSSTELERTQKVLFEIPVRYTSAAYTTCLPDTLVGITPSGQPLINTNASQYQATAANMLIGYSRDGFAIYGVDEDAALDACGGTVVSGVYRYHIRANEAFILGCYSHIPTPINF